MVPRLLKATTKEKSHWELCGGGFGIHWPDIDEDLSTDGLLRGVPAPNASQKPSKKATKQKSSLSRKRPRSSAKTAK